jgi:MFS transporter, PPP family, 3-phenylpropionic acid transporter
MAHAIRLRLALFYGASFAAIGVSLPYWPVWLAAQGLAPSEIGLLLAANVWPRVLTSVAIPHAADRLGRRRPLMLLLAGITVIGIGLFAFAHELWAFLLLSLVTGATWAAILPLGEALALQELKPRGIGYGPVRLWGSVTFILTSVGGGWWIGRRGPGSVLALLLALLLLNLLACVQLPEVRARDRPREPPRLAELLRLPGLVGLVFAAGLIQASHALYYGFASLHWRAAGLGDAVIGWLWAEGVVAEILLFAAAGPVLDALPPLRLLTLAGGLAALRWCLTAAGTDVALLIPAQALHGASFGAVHLAVMHQLRDRVPSGLLASAQGVYAAIGGAFLMGLVTPVAGWLYAGIRGRAFFAMAGLALAGTGLAAMLARGDRPAGRSG